MIYREKKIISGNMLEIEIYPISFKERKQSRSKKRKITLPAQKNLNDKNSRKQIVRLLNTNFTEKDLHLTLTYKDKFIPKNKESAKKDIDNFIRKIRRYIKKNKLEELKYISVIEYKKTRIHHHIVMNGVISRDILEDMWKKGRCNANRLQADENEFEALGKYITKEQTKKGEKKWSQSRNLKQPKVLVNDYKMTNKKIREIVVSQEEKSLFENLYKGYCYRDLKVITNDLLGETFIYIKMQSLRRK